MIEAKTITGATEEEVWQQVSADLSGEEVFEYTAFIQQASRQIKLDIDIDLGGGFEGGFEMTVLSAALAEIDFKFAIHREDFLDEIGKFFGMQDVKIGHEEFDKKILVKSNDEERVKEIFSSNDIRTFFIGLEDDFTFGITHHDGVRQLELSIERGITNPIELRNIYHRFYLFLVMIEPLAS